MTGCGPLHVDIRLQALTMSVLADVCVAASLTNPYIPQGLSLDQQQQMQLDAEAALFVQQQLGGGENADGQAERGNEDAVGLGVDEFTLGGNDQGQAVLDARDALAGTAGAAADGGQEGGAAAAEASGMVGEGLDAAEEGGLTVPSAAGEGIAAAAAAAHQYEDVEPGGESVAGGVQREVEGEEPRADPAGGTTSSADAAAPAPAAQGVVQQTVAAGDNTAGAAAPAAAADGDGDGAGGGADACAPPFEAVVKLEGNTEAASEQTGDAAADAAGFVAQAAEASAAGDDVGDVEAAVLGGRQRTAPSMLETLLSSN